MMQPKAYKKGDRVLFRWGFEPNEGVITRVSDDGSLFQVRRWNPLDMFFHFWLGIERILTTVSE